MTATNRNLEEAVLSGQFRSDLYYRISVVPVFLPPLRERREDVDLLALEFLSRFNKEHGVSLKLSKRAMDALRACDFPGNVRELESCIRRTAALAKDSVIVLEDLACSNGSCLSLMLGKSMSKQQSRNMGYIPLPLYSSPVERVPSPQRSAEPARVESGADTKIMTPAGNSSIGDESANERRRLVDAMECCGWVQAKAARILRLTPRQMGYALRKYKIEIKHF